MSLLLDALKRAAEQKAAKAREDESGSADGQDTELDASGQPARAGDDAEDGSIPRHQLEDETELDPSELNSRLERLRGSFADGTETRLEAPDANDSTLLPPSGRSRSAEDETLIFAADDATEAMLDEQADSARAAADDATEAMLDEQADSARAAADDVTEAMLDDQSDPTLTTMGDPTDLMHDDQVEPARAAQDETELSQQDSEVAVDERATSEDGLLSREDTVLQPPESSDDWEGQDPLPRPGEETDLSLPTESGGNQGSKAVDEYPDSVDKTDLSVEIPRGADSDTEDEDMSLLLVDREPTQLTDPQLPQDALQALQAEAPTADELGLVETTLTRSVAGPTPDSGATRNREQGGDNTTTRNQSGNTATTGIATATASLHNISRPDPGATQTHAPDNYDRTLMRLPNDDASKLFAGMKSDPDVVMTPDYAKRVFRSKTAAMRFQHFRFYGGIALVILLGVGVYGIFQFQAESEFIDANLLPLKNDPYPGAIPSADADAEPLFAEAEVNERAREILQSAETLDEQLTTGEDPASDPDVVENTDAVPTATEVPVEVAATATPQPATTESAAAPAKATRQPAGPVNDPVIPEPIAATESVIERKTVVATGAAAKSPGQEALVAATGSSRTTAANAGNTGSGLKIQTGERLEEKQVLLREAYDAYQSGDDVLALQRYNRVLAIDPENRNALLARGAIYIQHGDSGAAIEDYQTLLLANPRDSLAMASLLAVANYSPVETESHLKLMIRDEPESPHLNFALANAYAAQNRWQEAQGHYFKALQNNPEDPNYAYNLAVSLEHISQPRAAVSYYRRALENYTKGLATFSREAVDRRLEKLAKS